MKKRIKDDSYDVPELTAREIAAMRPASEVRPGFVTAYLRKRGRPPKKEKKVSITLRLDPDVAKVLRASGPGWQTRTNEHLAKWAKRQSGKR
jgi:uncharacterized protein (DUF4415 family)